MINRNEPHNPSVLWGSLSFLLTRCFFVEFAVTYRLRDSR